MTSLGKGKKLKNRHPFLSYLPQVDLDVGTLVLFGYLVYKLLTICPSIQILVCGFVCVCVCMFHLQSVKLVPVVSVSK